MDTMAIEMKTNLPGGGTSRRPVPAHKKPRRLALAVALAVLAGSAGGGAWYMTRPAAVANTVHVSGRIEGYEKKVGPKIGGRVDFIAVREGDLVSKGQLIVKISDDDVAAQLRGAQARILKAHEQAEQSAYQVDVIKSQIDEANLRLTQTREDTSAQVQQAAANVAQARAKLSESRASLVQAKAELELAKLRRQRYQLLAQQGAISADENDRVRTTCDTAEAVVTARGQSVKAAQEQLAMA